MQHNDFSELPPAPMESAESLGTEPLYSETEAAAVHAAVLAAKERRRLRLKKAAPKRKGAAKEPLTLPQILAWVDSHHSRTGAWPTSKSGPVFESPTDTWCAINSCLHMGYRGCLGGSSLSKLLTEHRIHRTGNTLRENWTEATILDLADRFFAAYGRWPGAKDGPVEDGTKATWVGIDIALRKGIRGLPGGSSLPLLLAKQRGFLGRGDQREFTYDDILVWADSHYARTGSWPNCKTGPILECPGDTWADMDRRMRLGQRGFDRKLSLAQFLHAERCARIKGQPSQLTEKAIIEWAKHHYYITGNWPTHTSGQVLDAPEEAWSAINGALIQGLRGLHRTTSLAKLIAEFGGKRITDKGSAPVDMQRVRQKINEYYAEHGVWPTESCKVPVSGANDGLRQDITFAELIAEELGDRTRTSMPDLTFATILGWCDSHKSATGDWPTANSGMVLDSPNESWDRLSHCMARGLRGLPEAISLSRLLERERGVPHRFRCDLTVELILAWADDYMAKHGEYPTRNSKQGIPQSPGDKWRHIDHALINGTRSLPGASSLSQVLVQHRGKRTLRNAPPLTPEQIEQWARLHFERTGTWPSNTAGGRVLDAPEEAWRAINDALAQGKRGLKGCGYRSLAELLDKRIRKTNKQD